MTDLGLQSGTVKLMDYNQKWPSLYEAEAKQLKKVLDIPLNRIRHVGSTSIPGMISKPVLDIAILVDSLQISETWKAPLEKIGYWYKGIEQDLPDRRFFAKGPRSNRTVYLHVVNQNEFDSLLKFRDTLQTDPSLAKEYASLKQKLAITNANNRDTYTLSKNNFIQRVLHK